MRRVRLFAACAALVFAVAATAAPKPQDKWATVKGTVVYPAAKAVPERKKLDVSQDKEHCLSKGDILDESLIVNPKNKGIKNVILWLRPDSDDFKAVLPKEQIHPDDAKRKPADVVIDQPCCMFIKRITTARVGDTIVVKNPAPVAHNFRWSSGNNGELNNTVAKESSYRMENPLVAENTAINFSCTIHPWMSGHVRVFDHPYFAVTDDDGKFEIKNAPVGKFRIVLWQEKVGFLGGKMGRTGQPVDIAAAGTEVKPIEFDIESK
jgi:plastocyanin